MPFELKKGRKRRASDADYAPPSSVKRTRTAAPSPQLTPLTSINHPGPQLEEDFPSDDPLPPSSAPGSPTFWDDDNELLIDEAPSHAPTPTHLFLKLLPHLPLVAGHSPRHFGRVLSRPMAAGLAYPLRIAILVAFEHRGKCLSGKDLQEARETAAHVEAQMLQLEAERNAAQKRDRAKQERRLQCAGAPHVRLVPPMHKVFELLFAARPEDPKDDCNGNQGSANPRPRAIGQMGRSAHRRVFDAFLSKASGRSGAVQGAGHSELPDPRGLGVKLKEMAPTLWEVLTAASSTHSPSTEVPETRRDRSLVFTTVCAMMSILRSQKANNFQAVIALFLLGSGASKREIEVFAHAGISLSYKSVMNYLDTLSREGVVQFQAVWRTISIIRIISTTETTATLIPIYNPFTNESRTPRGTLPFSMKPEHTSTLPNYPWTAANTLPSPSDAENTEQCLIWQLKSIALEYIPELAHLKPLLESCPEIDQIQLHKTEQFPLSAMHEDESTLEGDYHRDKQAVEGARRNSTDPLESMQPLVRRLGIFHAKMAGNRLVVNEHWGKPNATIPGGLCWEHTQLLQRKPISAGWKSKKAAPWKPCHELLQISSAGHVRDAFRIHCGEASFPEWAAKASFGDFVAVSGKVYSSLYTTAAYDDACARNEATRNAAFENSVLYNRDSLLYLLLVSSIKAGDIGRVILVFRIWATYDPVLQKFFLHNWLVNIIGIINRFKEVDLLQEHQNFWAKIVYNAKGVNQSWSWLGRPWKDQVVHVRDLFEEGANYVNTRGAFSRYTAPTDRLQSCSPRGRTWREQMTSTALDEENMQEDYEVSQEDLAMDDEEPYEMIDSLVGTAAEMVDDMD
ncbi:hypothetical protein B0H14DRAFT_2642513 [Mycena olivaceomarginata]|nr:hypothetical protein B0H14DRAFT_2642513 [Mycena olivaceomarginata]